MERANEFLGSFAAAEREVLAGMAVPRRFQPGDVVFREGERGREVYWIESGQVSLEICTPGIGCRRVMTLGPGDLLGWSPLLGGDEPMTATARAMTEVEGMAVDAQTLAARCAADPAFGFKLMQQVGRALARRLVAARLQLLDIHQQSIS